MANPFRYIRDRVQGNKIEKLAKKSGTTLENLPPFLNNQDTATLVLRALKRDKNMPALVFDWNPAGFNDVATAPGFRNGVAGQNLAAIIANLTANGATNYNSIIFTFPNGTTIGAWNDQISVAIPWAINQVGIPNVVNTVTRINRITERDTDTPFDLESYNKVFT